MHVHAGSNDWLCETTAGEVSNAQRLVANTRHDRETSRNHNIMTRYLFVSIRDHDFHERYPTQNGEAPQLSMRASPVFPASPTSI
jgi:hypothetical protein